MDSYDVIVVGTGGVGSAAMHQLAERGCRVLGLDRHPWAHSMGSSHGQTRIIRQAYFEHPDYVPLLLRAYELWHELNASVDKMLFHQVGLLEVGPADGVLIPGVMQSVTQHGLAIEQRSVRETTAEFPFVIPDEMEVVFEPTAGYLLVEDCVRAQLQRAIGAGAEWKQQVVVGWDANDRGVRVETLEEVFTAGQLVVCGGAWSSQLLRDIGVSLRVIQKHQYWFDAPSGASSNLPVFFFEVPSGWFYGFPTIGDSGMKLAQHSGGIVRDSPFDLATAHDEEDLQRVSRFAADHISFDVGDLISQQACMYTQSADDHFFIDRHPRHGNVVLAAGLSGHGFKFTPVLGLVLAQLASGEQPELPLDFLKIDRF